MEQQRTKVIIITGLAGAGKSVVIKSLEDLGFYCIDNLPVGLIRNSIDHLAASQHRYIALGMDLRDQEFAPLFKDLKPSLQADVDLDVLYLTADNDVIVDRFRTTRRKHPLIEAGGELTAAIAREKIMLEPIKAEADFIIDTSQLSPNQLNRIIEKRYESNVPARSLFVTITR